MTGAPRAPQQGLPAGWRAVLLACALVALAIALRIALGFRGGDTPIGVMFILPVVVAARYGGRLGGLAAIAAVALGTKLFLFLPLGSLAFASVTVFLHWLLIVLVGLVVTELVEDLRRASRRELTESEARRSRDARYLRFFENLKEGVTINALVRDANGVPVDARIVSANPQAEAWLRHPIDRLRGRCWTEVFGAAARAQLDRALALLREEPGATYEAAVGGRRVQVGAFALGEDEFVMTGVDVTEHRRLELQFQQAQRLESVGRLAGGVAHDFNNIVTVVLSSTEVLREDLRAGLPGDPALLDEITAAGERARDLTRQLLAFARRQVVHPVPLDAAGVLRSSERLLRRMLGEDVKLVVHAPPDLEAVVRADPVQLEQVLFNLAVNARDAMPRGGVLTIEVGATEVAANEPGGHAPGRWVVLVVRDDGTGMTPEVQAHAFEPFFTTKEAGKGTGLGLATVHGIVVQAGGHVHLRSEPGAGTEFRICLPRCDEHPAAAVGGRAAPAPGLEAVLVVEDDAQVRTVTLRALSRAGYRVLAASSGEEALELAARAAPPVDLLVTDLVMPGMGGHALAAELLRRRPGLKVLFVSGYSQEALSDRRALAPDEALLAKPFTPADLLARVREVLAAPAA